MKKILVLLVIMALALAFVYGCGKKEAEDTDKVPVEVKEAEVMDSTRMDSAVMLWMTFFSVSHVRPHLVKIRGRSAPPISWIA